VPSRDLGVPFTTRGERLAVKFRFMDLDLHLCVVEKLLTFEKLGEAGVCPVSKIDFFPMPCLLAFF